MDKNLKDKLYKDFPWLFEDVYCGFTCGSGWYGLIYNLCLKIKEFDLDKEVRVRQVKEKFGGLRFYINGGSEEIFNEILKAEDESLKICERCGKPGKLKDIGVMSTWLKTLCENCNV